MSSKNTGEPTVNVGKDALLILPYKSISVGFVSVEANIQIPNCLENPISVPSSIPSFNNHLPFEAK